MSPSAPDPPAPDLPDHSAASRNTLEPVASLASASAKYHAGTVIGPYKLLEQIGGGGMGVVYMAEQLRPVHRKVALKIIKPGMDSGQVIARFEAERQALTMMDHPNIAKVLDAGTTDAGRPYFVMELVKGIPITDYCDRARLNTHERLALMIQVCHAVQHAHTKGVIHRDLKPTNVLVTLHDDKPVPKVIDFGIAKAAGHVLTDKTLFTNYAQMLGTPLYMSPEQAQISGLDVDTRSDVYSLGVLLYELLTGTTPFDQRRLREAAYDEMRRIIREEDPPNPSTRLSTMGEEITAISAHRHTEPRKLSQLVRGELDWIVMKALEKDRSRRYETANGLAQDVEHYLHDEMVQACPPSAAYRVRKFVRRNKAGALFASVVALALMIGLTIALIGFVRARREADRADREAVNTRSEAARSEQFARFLQDMLRGVGPAVARGRDTTMLREVLDKTITRVDDALKNQPEVQADLLMTLGETYYDLGDYSKAQPLFARAAEQYRLVRGDVNPKAAVALSRLGLSQCRLVRLSDGRANARNGLEMARQCGDRQAIASCLYNVGLSLSQGGLFSAEAAPMFREAAGLSRDMGDNPVFLADCTHALACATDAAFSHSGSEALHREALSLYRQHLPPDHPSIANNLYTLGKCVLFQKKFAEAETIAREVYELDSRVFGPNHFLRQAKLQFVAEALLAMDKPQEIEALLEREVQRVPSNGTAWMLLGELCIYQNNPSAAIEYFARAADASPDNYNIGVNYATALCDAGRIDEYRRYCHKVLDRYAAKPDPATAGSVVGICRIKPLEGNDLERAGAIAKAGKGEPAPAWSAQFGAYEKAVSALTGGQSESAIQSAQQVIDDPNAWGPTISRAHFVQARAQARLGRTGSAREALARGEEIFKEVDRRLEVFGGHWRNMRLLVAMRAQAMEEVAAAATTQP